MGVSQQVKVKEAEEASKLYTRLMGDDDETRRDFIHENAYKDYNLDILLLTNKKSASCSVISILFLITTKN